jgi:nitrite reductase/ring-hydroxylating ferredoxin subunit
MAELLHKMQINNDFLKSGEMCEVEVYGKSVLLLNIDEKYYGVGNVCPHLKCKLHRGSLKKHI